MIKQFSHKASKTELCKWLVLPESVYYYKHKTSCQERKPSKMTLKANGAIVLNDEVVCSKREVLAQEFCCYGYHNITSELKDLGYLINHKKVYRLISENNLLLGKANIEKFLKS